MFQALLLIAAVTATAPAENSPVQSKNGEFIFRQYPPRAKAAGEQGSVRFQAEVDAKGNVMSCKVTQGSGHERLDRETCELIANYASFRPALDSEGTAREATHDGVVNWRLPGVVPAAKVASIGGRPLDEVVCKRSSKTGSLIATTKRCMTRREWIQFAEEHQDDVKELQEKIGWQPCSMRPGDGLPTC